MKQPKLPIMAGLTLALALLQTAFAQIELHQFGAASRAVNGVFSIELLGSAPPAFRDYFDLYVVESSSDLVNWTYRTTLLRTNSAAHPLTYVDTEAVGLDRRFYRMRTNHFFTPLPKPTGPHGVGILSRLISDPSRTNRYEPGTDGSFMVSFWYPAEIPAGSLRAVLWEKPLAEHEQIYTQAGIPARPWIDIIPQFVAHEIEEVPLAVNQARYPLVILSHGWYGTRRRDTLNAGELASHGYIVVAMDHADCHATVFPDGRVYRQNYSRLQNLASLVPGRIDDGRLVLDELARIDATDPILRGRLALDRIGMMGMSLGTADTAEVDRRDERVKCAVFLDGAIFLGSTAELRNEGLKKPFLALNQANQPSSDPYDFLRDAQRLFELAAANATWLRIRGATHGTFQDWAWMGINTSQSRRASLASRASVLRFFDRHLKGSQEPFPPAEFADVLVDLKTK